MGASATLRPAVVTVEPGGSATCELGVRNAGKVVDEFTFEIRGDAAAWTSVEPAKLSLFPGTEGTVQVRFQPPRSSTTPSGSVPFAVKVLSSEDPEGSSVEEGSIEIGAFQDVFAEILPRTSHGNVSARHQLAVDNRGNSKINAKFEAVDPDQLLRLEVRPPAVVGDPGTASFTSVRVRPKKRFLRGQPKTHPFQVLVHPDGAAPITVEATYLQEPIVPRWLPKLLLGLAMLAIGLAVAWFSLFRPAVESTAKKTAKEEADKAVAAGVAGLDSRLKKLEGGPLPTPTSTIIVVSSDAAGKTPFDRRITAASSPGNAFAPANASPETSYTVPAGQRLSITDILLQNPQGDAGRLRVFRNDVEDVLLEERLENFRDLDYHFVTPIVFNEGDVIRLQVQCQDPGGDEATCRAALSFTGTLERVST